MAYDEGLAERLRDVFTERDDVNEKKMFGGIAFMVRGNMCCGIVGDDLMARVGPDADADALARPHARPMNFTGHTMKGFVYVAPEGVAEDEDLRAWVDRALEFVLTLPAK
jgi:TfoX/Sxy family transcriptional regulator of competence genes